MEIEANMSDPEKSATTLPGTVERIIPANALEAEKAQISIEGAEHTYKEIRIDNTLKDGPGKDVSLKLGAHVEVTIEADHDAAQ
jgi:hypothetical protein